MRRTDACLVGGLECRSTVVDCSRISAELRPVGVNALPWLGGTLLYECEDGDDWGDRPWTNQTWRAGAERRALQ